MDRMVGEIMNIKYLHSTFIPKYYNVQLGKGLCKL